MLVGLLHSSPGHAADAEPETLAAPDFRKLDLSGDWYVLIHYKDTRSEDRSITQFRDFAWSIQQSAGRMVWEKYPYVIFDDATELQRRHAMMEHLPWEPNGRQWKSIGESLGVSSRAMTRKRLSGSVEKGFRSQPAQALGGANLLTFSRAWHVSFEESRIRIEIIDSLSGTDGLAGMEEATVFVIDQQPGPGELRGSWRESSKQGTLRVVRTRERKLLK